MSIPKPPQRKPGPLEIASTWQAIYSAVLAELSSNGALTKERAVEVAAYVAATLAKEAKHGNSPRDN